MEPALDTSLNNAQQDLTGNPNPVVIDLTNVESKQDQISPSVPAAGTQATNAQDTAQTDGTFALSQSTEMASSFITYALQVDFESVLKISDHEGMVNMFKALEASGLCGFLGCPSVFYEKELEQFFDTALVQDGDITVAVSGKFFAISETRFAEVLKLPTEGLVDLSEMPKNLVYDARSIFSKSGEPIPTYGKKRLMKYEFRLLNDLLAKSITVKAGSFNAVTHEIFLMMNAVHFGIKVNWSKILFGVLKEMVDKSLKKAKVFAAQICVLLKSDPVITMGEATTFPYLKILSLNTVKTYIATNETIDARGKSDEPGMAKVAIVKSKIESKKKSESNEEATGEEPVEVVSEKFVSKKRPTIVVPLQIIEPTTVATIEQPPVPKRKSKNRRLRLPKGSDDENVEERVAVENVENVEKPITVEVNVGETVVEPTEEERHASSQVETNDDVDVIIGQEFHARQAARTVETASDTYGDPELVTGEQQVPMFVEKETVAESEGSKDVVVAKVLGKSVGSNQIDEELMTLDDLLMQISDDMMLPSVTAAEITKIKSDLPIEIKEVHDQDCYYSSLPKISATEKGKAPLEEDDTVKGNPAREMVQLICANVDFLVHVRPRANY
ncbi:hypothetical protein F511_31899 [Dorcoceras hygrometricum]|uniref:Dystroglycan-like n=1 Tax=Dorcoceras hygrometricum TaxID=472368 RepID=A0A2Z7BLC5_9LAMI|nr:hypothetical protein F511_31899 [Dorcoceras hygrometricum]